MSRLDLAVDDHIATVTLDKPPVNALAAGADVIVAADDAVFGMPEINPGTFGRRSL